MVVTFIGGALDGCVASVAESEVHEGRPISIASHMGEHDYVFSGDELVPEQSEAMSTGWASGQ